MKIGILREEKSPTDNRVTFAPEQCEKLSNQYKELSFVVQPSDVRCFADHEYVKAGAELSEDLSTCDILFGVKEVLIPKLVEGKPMVFFSHTIKEQPYNKELFKACIEKKITLIDHELLKQDGARVVAFGRFAGLVGAYNGLRGYGQKSGMFSLPPAHKAGELSHVFDKVRQLEGPAIRVVLTGNGRVSLGAEEILSKAGLKRISPEVYLSDTNAKGVYVMLGPEYYTRATSGKFDLQKFFNDPTSGYETDFPRFMPSTDLFVAGAYWDHRAPVLFEKSDLDSSKIRVIADITCDIEGSIPTTKRPTTIDSPFYDYDTKSHQEVTAFTEGDTVTIMAVDNLPNELPIDASRAFGDMLSEHVLPGLMKDGVGTKILSEASILKDGELTENFRYLSDYAS